MLIAFAGVNPNPNPTVKVTVRVRVNWGHLQDKNFIVYTSLKHLSLNVYDAVSYTHLTLPTNREV